MKIESWDELLTAITCMSSEQRKMPVYFLEGYEDFKICEVARLLVTQKEIKDLEGGKLSVGQIYLEG